MMVTVDKEKIIKTLTRRADPENGGHIFPSIDLVVDRFAEGKELSFYLGMDPTAPELHIGHSVVLLLLKSVGDLGHKITLLIGDFTARIGDPTDKESARKVLTKEDVLKNMGSYIEQVSKILPRDSFDIKYNSSWLDKMSFEDVVRLTSHFTVQQMMQRDMFQERIKKEKPIFLHEFLYPIMQGYDSVAMEVDGEIGGNDQVFNMLVGREFEKEILKKDKIVLATRLLVDSVSGKKISKTEGGFIAFNDSPRIIFEKVMNNIPDEMIKTVFELCTEVEQDRIDKMEVDAKKGEDYDFRKFNSDLAYELVRTYHNEEEAKKARQEVGAISKGELPKEIKEVEVDSQNNSIVQTIYVAGIRSSMSASKKLVEQKAVSINGRVIDDWEIKVSDGDLVKVGKSDFRKVKIK